MVYYLWSGFIRWCRLATGASEIRRGKRESFLFVFTSLHIWWERGKWRLWPDTFFFTVHFQSHQTGTGVIDDKLVRHYRYSQRTGEDIWLIPEVTGLHWWTASLISLLGGGGTDQPCEGQIDRWKQGRAGCRGWVEVFWKGRRGIGG